MRARWGGAAAPDPVWLKAWHPASRVLLPDLPAEPPSPPFATDPQARMCEDAPKLASGLADLTRELVVAAVDALFYAYQLK